MLYKEKLRKCFNQRRPTAKMLTLVLLHCILSPAALVETLSGGNPSNPRCCRIFFASLGCIFTIICSTPRLCHSLRCGRGPALQLRTSIVRAARPPRGFKIFSIQAIENIFIIRSAMNIIPANLGQFIGIQN